MMNVGYYNYTLEEILKKAKWNKYIICKINELGFPKKLIDNEGKVPALFEVPNNMFITPKRKVQQWYDSIEMATTKNFRQIGILSTREGLYMGFNGDDREAFVKHEFEPNKNAHHGRNQ